MSAFRGKADAFSRSLTCPLMTQRRPVLPILPTITEVIERTCAYARYFFGPHSHAKTDDVYRIGKGAGSLKWQRHRKIGTQGTGRSLPLGNGSPIRLQRRWARGASSSYNPSSSRSGSYSTWWPGSATGIHTRLSC